MPGARLSKQPSDGRAEGEMKVKLGPIVSTFVGALDIERDDTEFTGLIRGAGRDLQSGSGVRAIISYKVQELDKASSQVLVSVKFMLTGTLAHFGRLGLVKDVANHLTRIFADNLASTLSGRPIEYQQMTQLSASHIDSYCAMEANSCDCFKAAPEMIDIYRRVSQSFVPLEEVLP